MRPIQRNEVLPLGVYEGIRPHFRARVIEEKKARRFSLGPHISGVFENRDTVLLQIQEMLRTERITREDAILHEIETYNELIPSGAEVSMRMMSAFLPGVREPATSPTPQLFAPCCVADCRISRSVAEGLPERCRSARCSKPSRRPAPRRSGLPPGRPAPSPPPCRT